MHTFYETVLILVTQLRFILIKLYRLLNVKIKLSEYFYYQCIDSTKSSDI